MQKTLKFTGIFALIFLCLTMLISCGSVSQKYADKVNKAVEDEKTLTVEQVRKDLGTETSGLLVAGAGVLVWQTTKDKTTKTLSITFLKNAATKAVYLETTTSE